MNALSYLPTSPKHEQRRTYLVLTIDLGTPRSSQVGVLHSVREQHAAAERKLQEADSVLERRLDGVEELAQVPLLDSVP